MADESENNSKKTRKEPNTPNSSDEEPDVPPSAFTLAALGLHRVGRPPSLKPQPQQPIQLLNARGRPARIRKRNRLFYDENILNDDKPWRIGKKTPKNVCNSLPVKSPTEVVKNRKGVVSRYMRPDANKSAIAPIMRTGSTQSSSANIKPKSSTVTKSASMAPPNSSVQVNNDMQIIQTDKKIGQKIGMQLRNLLKLPKAHRWVICEWFYSFIDKVLFEGKNEFQACLAESFPNLKTRQMTRSEWRNIRSMIGKPRRCSQAFFDEERRELDRCRQKIRYMQIRKSGEENILNFLRNLPDKIPMPLPVGTKVTARLHRPYDSILSGTVAAFDSMSSVYRIAFDRNHLGTHSIPDYEIVSEDFHEMLPLRNIIKDCRPNLMSVYNGVRSPMRNRGNRRAAFNMNTNISYPVMAQEVIDSPFKEPILGSDNINGYPAKLLEIVVLLKHALSIKKSKLQRLSEMNNEAELKASQKLATDHYNLNSSDDSQNIFETLPQLSEDFQRRYASIITSMDRMNKDMQDYLNDVQSLSIVVAKDPQLQAMLTPSYLRETCREAATKALKRNCKDNSYHESVMGLIMNLATAMLVASHLGKDNNTAEVSKAMEGCIEEIRSTLEDRNIETFQNYIQTNLHNISSGLGQKNKGVINATVAHSAAGESDERK